MTWEGALGGLGLGLIIMGVCKVLIMCAMILNAAIVRGKFKGNLLGPFVYILAGAILMGAAS